LFNIVYLKHKIDPPTFRPTFFQARATDSAELESLLGDLDKDVLPAAHHRTGVTILAAAGGRERATRAGACRRRERTGFAKISPWPGNSRHWGTWYA
jgi:hypothetical protein